MPREDLIFVGTCDLAGLVRGKSFPVAAWPERVKRGVGIVPSAIMVSAFGPIYDTPFGTEGDLTLRPDPATRVEVPFDAGAAERFCLGDILTTEGEPWECCPRHFLCRALAALRETAGLAIRAAFEQEFVYSGVDERASSAVSLDRLRRAAPFGEALLAAIRTAGATPDTFIAEAGPRQFEITVAPAEGMRAADEAVIVRELARGVAWRFGERASFVPMPDAQGTGNGVHIHFTLCDDAGAPVMHDPAAPDGLAAGARQFAAGILHHMPALAALTAPSMTSYARLTPNRWAPTWTNLGYRDRAAALRVCPLFAPESAEDAARQFHLEYRVCDAAASPYMALGAMVWAGVDGLRQRMSLPPAPRRFWDLSENERLAAGARPLPRTLGDALAALAATDAAREWFGDLFLDVYLRFKRAELRALAGLGTEAIFARYADVY